MWYNLPSPISLFIQTFKYRKMEGGGGNMDLTSAAGQGKSCCGSRTAANLKIVHVLNDPVRSLMPSQFIIRKNG